MTSDRLFSSKDFGLKYKVVLQLPRLCLLANFPASTITAGGVQPYMDHIGMCRCEGYGFQAVYSRREYINHSLSLYSVNKWLS